MSEQHESHISRISQSSLNLDSLLASFDDAPELKRTLQVADVIILPTDLSPEYEGPAFPDTTHEIFQRLRHALGEGAIVEAAVREEDYAEIVHLSETEIILPTIYVAEKVLLPLAIGLLASFVYDYLRSRRSQRSGGNVKSGLHFKDRNGTCLSHDYDGPADIYERVTMEQFRALGLLADENKVSRSEENDDDSQSN